MTIILIISQQKQVENSDKKVDLKQEIFNPHAQGYLGRLFRMLLGYYTHFTFYIFLENQTALHK